MLAGCGGAERHAPITWTAIRRWRRTRSAKERIFANAATVVLNADDPWVAAMRDTRLSQPAARTVTFSITRERHGFFAGAQGAQIFLARRGERLLDTARMKISGLHNAANALAALALGEAVGLPDRRCSRRCESFPGLSHRSSWVADIGGVRYIDDSKGTNVGATIAAVAGLPGPLVHHRRRRGQGAGLRAAGRGVSRQGARSPC